MSANDTRAFDVIEYVGRLGSAFAESCKKRSADIYKNISDAGTNAIIVARPYSGSAMGVTTPSPIFLKKVVASSRTETAGRTLLDGGAAPGMSRTLVTI